MDAQQREERKKSIGGTDAGVILGLSKWKTRVGLYLEKTGRGPVEDAPTIPQLFGIYAEEFVAQQYEKKTQRHVIGFKEKIVHPEFEYFTGNVDRLVVPENLGASLEFFNRGLECKAVSAYVGGEWGDDDSDDVPPIYYVQCQWYMGLRSHFRYWDLAPLIGNARFEVYEFIRDDSMIEMIQAKAREFWFNHIVADVAPEPVSEADVLALFPKSTEAKKVEATKEIEKTVAQLKLVRAEIESKTEEKERLNMEIKNFMQDAEALVLVDAQGKPLTTWKNNKDSTKTDWESAYDDLFRKCEIYNLAAHAELDGLRKELMARHTKTVAGSRVFLVKK